MLYAAGWDSEGENQQKQRKCIACSLLKKKLSRVFVIKPKLKGLLNQQVWTCAAVTRCISSQRIHPLPECFKTLGAAQWQLDIWSPPQPEWAGGRKVYRADDRLSYNESSLFAQQLFWGKHNKRLGDFLYFPPLSLLSGDVKRTQDGLYPLALTCLEGKIPSWRWMSRGLSPLVISVLTDWGVSITMQICG